MSIRLAVVLTLVAGCGRLGFDAAGGGDDESGGGGPDAGTTGDGGADVADGAGEVAGCEVSGTCAAQIAVPGGTFLRGNDHRYPATVGGFTLDRYEVTVGRFRVFLDAGRGVQGSPPPVGAGAHPSIEGSGWRSMWNGALEADRATLEERLARHGTSTFTPDRGTGEDRPINWVRWYEAFAFCIWDGGRLPTYAEQQFAAVGGAEQRTFPWGSNPLVASDDLERVGHHSPATDGRWGHADLVGNVDEWSLDYFGTMPTPCTNCANLSTHTTRLLHGFYFGLPETNYVATPLLHGAQPGNGNGVSGFRCAR